MKVINDDQLAYLKVLALPQQDTRLTLIYTKAHLNCD